MIPPLTEHRFSRVDPHELRILLDKRIGGPGQYHNRKANPDVLHLPLAGASCKIALTFRDKRLVDLSAGPSFDVAEWAQLCQEIDSALLAGSLKVGRGYSFSSFRVLGSWRGLRSGLQIVPPPNDAPHVPFEMAHHPFILEFPLQTSELPEITYRRLRHQHRRFTLLMNVLLAGRITLERGQIEHCWAVIPQPGGTPEIKWVQKGFHARLGAAVLDDLSPQAPEKLNEVEPKAYHRIGHDGEGLRVPSDLDQLISLYGSMPAEQRVKFDRAAFWLDTSSRQWSISVSASFASLVSAVESLAGRKGGAKQRFVAFVERYAPGSDLSSGRNDMYRLRSDILHGSDLMQLDEEVGFGWDPGWWTERGLHDQLWGLVRIALRNWLIANNR